MIRATLEERKVSIKMKNKKGFTLVELLAVIAILAILVVIALPNVMGMFNSAKKNSFITEVQTLMSQSETDYVTNTFGANSKSTLFTNDTSVNTTLFTGAAATHQQKTLSIQDGESKKYAIKVDKAGKIQTVKVIDGNFCFYVDGTDLQKSDVTPNGVYEVSSSDNATLEACKSGVVAD